MRRRALIEGIALGLVFLSLIGGLIWVKLKPPLERPRFLFNIFGEAKSPLKRPLAVATRGGKIYVTDSGKGEIKVFNQGGTFLFSFPVSSSIKRKVSSYPAAVTLDNRGRIYVSDLKSQRLFVFSSRGKYLSDFPKRSKNLKKPLALTFAQNKLYVVDGDDQKVKIFDLKERLLFQFGKPGKGRGEFSYPNGLAVSREGLIYVADSNNRRVQVFTKKGKFIKSFGEKIFTLPRGLVLDQFGRIYVVDTFGSRVLVFGQKGKLFFSYQAPEVEESFPQGIAVDPNIRRIYITDRLNNNLSVWQY